MLFNIGSKPNRREWFRSLGRLIAFTGLSGIGLLTLRNNKEANTHLNDDPCSTQSLCQECTILSNCSLPQAIHTRQYKEEVHNG